MFDLIWFAEVSICMYLFINFMSRICIVLNCLMLLNFKEENGMINVVECVAKLADKTYN